MKKVTPSLDGVFFTDGGFVGPNQKGLWEQIADRLRAEAHLRLANIVRQDPIHLSFFRLGSCRDQSAI
jgi:hypothetical protein